MNREFAYTLSKGIALLAIGFFIGTIIKNVARWVEYKETPVVCQPIPHRH